MSAVSNYLLKIDCSAQADRIVASLNRSLDDERDGFVAVAQHAGGPKHMECNVYLMATNYNMDTELTVLLREEQRRLPQGTHLVIPHSIQLFCQHDQSDAGMVLIYSN